MIFLPLGESFSEKNPRKIDKMLPIVNQQELEREKTELLFVYFSALNNSKVLITSNLDRQLYAPLARSHHRETEREKFPFKRDCRDDVDDKPDKQFQAGDEMTRFQKFIQRLQHSEHLYVYTICQNRNKASGSE